MLKTCYGAIGISGAFWSELEDQGFPVHVAGLLAFSEAWWTFLEGLLCASQPLNEKVCIYQMKDRMDL